MGLDVSWKGWAALATFALQNGLAILLVRYSKLHDRPYSSQVAVLLQEGAVKLPVSMLMYAWECGGGLRAYRSIAEDLRQRPVEWLQLSVPALLYTVQNTMLYVGFANVEAAVGQVTYQSKILWTALFSVLIVGKRLSPNQWLSLVVLALGIAAASCGQAASAPPSASASEPTDDVVAVTTTVRAHGANLCGPPRHLDIHGACVDEHGAHHGTGRGHGVQNHTRHPVHHPEVHHSPRATTHGRLLREIEAQGDPLMGMGALVLAAVCTAFASVYFEKMIKGESKPSLWLRNIQLAAYCTVVATLGIVLAADPRLKEEGWLDGFSSLTWFCLFFQAFGGLLVAVTIKYADNILRGFAQGLALIIGAVGSYFLFGFKLSLTFCGGVLLVIAAIFLYGSPYRTPHELCGALCRGKGDSAAPFAAVPREERVSLSATSDGEPSPRPNSVAPARATLKDDNGAV